LLKFNYYFVLNVLIGFVLFFFQIGKSTLVYVFTIIFFWVFFCLSIDKVQKITSPVLVIHGTEDEVIDFSHGLAIFERCPRTVEPLWVEGAGHNDVELYGQYLERLKVFINSDLAIN